MPAARQDALPHPPRERTAWVTDRLLLQVREAPAADAPAVGTVDTGDELTVIGPPKERWVPVRLEDGTEGWVPEQYLEAEPPARVVLQELRDRLELVSIERDRLQALNDAAELDRKAMRERLEQAGARIGELQSQVAALRKRLAAPMVPASRATELEEALQGERDRVRLLKERLEERTRREQQLWFALGGAVATLGFLLGWLASRMGGRRERSGWRR